MSMLSLRMYILRLRSLLESQTAVDREYTVQVIQLDIERTFPQLCIFQKVSLAILICWSDFLLIR